ncbi:protein Tob1-like [Ruditapes philippinarum]|uniref:protein Tob1-like n=1 Tax=Ruditapes philippinarum TaxID=129788 RepID=UPI00295AF7F2|nr:protein Tob1-like [Ruditapes philippinarum]XP_060607272.1 protein Tob1-like [Ruditapes philippinarum]XP_060607273.1 protein Tob1-like [Ruditapes philippinarum]XP_060607274.1 protein Tob1-like [Ruditapes philippinarum]
MHVEVNVALNFVISYLYNKLPRRRVDLFGTELEKGLKKKFEGHWYPDQPVKGSGFRCVRVNGEKIDPVIIQAASSVGLNLDEMQDYLPKELTIWIDPNEVSYRIGEKGQVKILYSDKTFEENNETEDHEVQVTNRGFNPEAQAFNPDAESFEPIDRLSASLGTLNLSPHSGGLSPSDISPVSSSSWGGSQSTSPSGGAPFPSLSRATSPPPVAYAPKRQGNQLFTTATFAQTKFGSTKLKSNAKRPTRLSPTEFGNFFRQKAVPNNVQYPGLTTPPRSRSLSPRDPRVEFLIDQQQRFIHNQHQQQLQQQFQQQQQMLHQQQLSYQLQQQQQQQFQQQQNRLGIPSEHHFIGNSTQHVSGSLHEMFSGPSPLQSPVPSPMSPGSHPSSQSVLPSPQSQLLQGHQGQQSPGQSPLSIGSQSSANSLQISPENQKALFDGLGLNNGPYSSTSQYHHLLLAS